MPIEPENLQLRRLSVGDAGLALAVFAMMASVFDEASCDPGLVYVERLLRREDFWAVAALEGQAPVGGLTAFTLPLTRSQGRELLVYDLAVLQTHRRRGIGRSLMRFVQALAAAGGVTTCWVPAANEDGDALDFYRAIGGSPASVTIFTFDRD